MTPVISFFGAYAARQQLAINTLGMKLGAQPVAQEQFSSLTGTYQGKPVYVGVAEKTVLSTSPELLKDSQLEPLVLDWALHNPAGLEWLIDGAPDDGFALQGMVLRAKHGDDQISYNGPSMHAAMRPFLTQLKGMPRIASAFALLTAEFRIRNQEGNPELVIDWDAHIDAYGFRPDGPDQATAVLRSYFELSNSLNFKPLKYSQNKLASFGEPLQNLYKSNVRWSL